MLCQCQGLIEAVKDSIPNATHRKCARHILANMSANHPGKSVQKYFWIACKAYNAGKFNWAMQKLQDVRPGAYRWLMEIPSEQWARHMFDASLKNVHVTSNVAESFNAWIRPFRGLPIYNLMDGIRGKVMARLERKRRQGLQMEGLMCSNTQEKLFVNRDMSSKCKMVSASNNEFEVFDEKFRFGVLIDEMHCDCGEWQLDGVPCRHACKALEYLRVDLEKYCDPCFSVERFRIAYAPVIHPVPDNSNWPPMNSVHPKYVFPYDNVTKIGRPKKLRRREAAEKRKPTKAKFHRCGICRQYGMSVTRLTISFFCYFFETAFHIECRIVLFITTSNLR